MALTRITKGVIKPNENYDTHNIVSTGIVTSIGLDINGNADISGSLSVGGVLTYEDVTSIDSIGIITARTGLVSPYADIDDFVSVGNNIHLGNAGVITATSFVGSGAALTGIDATAIKDSGGNVKIQAQASGAIHTGVSTFQDLDVDGHTNLDNVSIAGVSTFSNGLFLPDNKQVKLGNTAASPDFKIYHNTVANTTSPPNYLYPNSNYIDSVASQNLFIRTSTAGIYLGRTDGAHAASFHTNGSVVLYHNASGGGGEKFRTNSTGINITGTVTATGADINGDLDVDGHTNLDNVSIAGFTTITQDLDVDGHTNLDNVNIAGVTTTTGNVNVGGYVVSQGTSGRGGIFGQVEVGYDGTYLTIQPTSGHNDLHLNFDNGSTVQIGHTNGSTLTVNGNIKPKTDSASDLGLTGTRFRAAYVDTYYGDGSNLTGITGTTINNNANNRLITGSGTANTLEGESTITYDNPTLEINTDTSPYGTLTLNGTTGGLVQFEDNEVTKWSIFGDHALNFYNNANSLSRLYINSSGQMGLGVEPNTNWPTNNDFKALQIGTGACVFGRGSGDEDRGGIAVNWYSDGSNNKYLGNGNAARIYLADGNIYFSTAGANSSGANAAMTLNDRMILSSSGRLGLAGFQHNYTMNSSSTDLVIGDGGGGRGITFWTAGAADNQTISFQCNENLSRAEGEISYGPTATSTATDRNAMMFRTNSAERLRITSTGRFGFNRSAPHYAMHLSPASGETRIDLHMTNDTTGHNAGDGVQFGYQNVAGAYIWNFENTPIYMATNNVKKFEIHATGSTQIYKGDLLLGPDSVSQMEATIRAWGCSLWFTTIDPNYFHDSGGEYRQFYNKGSFRGDNYLTAYNCPIQTGVGPQNRNFWRGANGDTRAEGSLDINVGYRGAWFFIGQTSCASIPYQGSGRYLFDRGSARCSVSFDSFGNSIESGELSFHCGNSPGYNSGNCTIGGRLGSSNSDSTLRMYCVGVNMENYNAPNSKRAGNHLGISVINDDGTDYGSSRLSENLINNSTTGGTNSASGEFNWGNRHSNDRGGTTTFRHSQLLYFDDVQLNSAQWDYLEHYFKVMYG